MLRLRSSPASPFVRKVRIAADLLGLADRIALLPADTTDPDDPVRAENPLGKIPTLLLEDGTAIYDSPVIVAYLNELGRGTLIPSGPLRFDALVREALGDGIAEAALLRVYEGRYRSPETHAPRWLDHQSAKIARGLDEAAHKAGSSRLDAVDIGHVALACALGYLDLRAGGAWRSSHPDLAGWLDAFRSRVPAFDRTAAPA